MPCLMAIVVAVAGAGDVVESGLRSILQEAPDLEVLDEFPHFGVIPDVVVYDVVGVEADDGSELFGFLGKQQSAVVVVGRHHRPELASRAMAQGAMAYVSLEADTSEILSVIRDAATQDPGFQDASSWPPALGAEADLSAREVDLLGLVVRGRSNQEIAEQMSLSPNTVKSYIRSAYRKIGVATRPQAVAWCIQRGFDPEPTVTAVNG
jgi:two-component system, NarL family, nitrate/nitrite response regulator NarL